MKKKSITPSQPEPKTLFLVILTLISGAFFLGGMSPAKADEVFSSDFSKGTIDSLGWQVKGNWALKDYGADKPDLKNNPGLVVKYAANEKTPGTLTKTFAAVTNPPNLKLTFDAGYGWGNKDHSQDLEIMLLDADGNGYVFRVMRANATWGVQWGVVAKYVIPSQLKWSSTAINTTQPSVMDGGGLRTFTITRDSNSTWAFNSADWTGGPFVFYDTTYTSFSQVVLGGEPNTDDLLYGKIKLEADPASQ